MSLTRAEWEEMWESIKKIEILSTYSTIRLELAIKKETNKIKEQIQQVIGQME